MPNTQRHDRGNAGEAKRPSGGARRAHARLFTRREALAVACVAAAGAAGALFGCTRAQPAVISEEVYLSPYNWAGLQRDGEQLSYYEDGLLKSRWGIDVSEHQQEIDWAAVAASGVQFAFVRVGNRGATQGTLSPDEQFVANALGAHDAGIPTSAYFFSQAITVQEAREEAAFALGQMRAAEAQGAVFERVAFDHEPVNVEGARANDLTGEDLGAVTDAFCKAMTQDGRKPLVYGNVRDMLRLPKEVRKAWPVWLAEYDVEHPGAPFDFQIWQYSNAGTIPGIPTPVDLNLWLEV